MQVLVFDAAGAIKNGFKKVLVEEPNVRSNVKKNAYRCSHKPTAAVIIKDIDVLQLACNSDIFDKASNTFLEKGKAEKFFIEYFEKEWLIQNRNWFEGAAANNALVAFNCVIKDSNTFRKRFPIAQFLTVASKMVAGWSVEYKTSKLFVSIPSIPLSLWTKSYQWVISNPTMGIVLNKRVGKLQYFCVPAPTFTAEWTTFDEKGRMHVLEIEIFKNFHFPAPGKFQVLSRFLTFSQNDTF